MTLLEARGLARRYRGATALDDVSLQLRAGERLATYKRPREVRFVDALPRTANGKVVRRDLG